MKLNKMIRSKEEVTQIIINQIDVDSGNSNVLMIHYIFLTGEIKHNMLVRIEINISN